MDYPEGAIKTVDKLFEVESNGVSIIYYASLMHGMQELRILSISIAQMIDGNLNKMNGYNDWFMFIDKNQAKAYMHQKD